MCPDDGLSSPAQDLEQAAWQLYVAVVERLAVLQLQPLDNLGPDGSQQMNLPGVSSALSPGGMDGLALSLSWAIELWKSSGLLPDPGRLRSFVQSVEGGPLESIITPLCLSMIVSWSVLIASGEYDSALHICESMMEVEVPHSTAANMSRKIIPASESGISSTQSGIQISKMGSEHPLSIPSDHAGKRTARTKKKRSKKKVKGVSSTGRKSKKKKS